MNLKITIIAILVAVFGYVFVLQTNTVSALNSPVTSPITGPITGPVTFAGFKLQGKVTLKSLKRWWRSFHNVLPAQDVTVTAKNRQTGEKVETQTDAEGEYEFTLPSGKYRVSVEEDHVWFVPPHKNVNLKKNVDNINFKGFTWKHNDD